MANKYRIILDSYRDKDGVLFPYAIQRKHWFGWRHTNLYATSIDAAKRLIGDLNGD